jgi:Domain of unknown function (DUF4328)
LTADDRTAGTATPGSDVPIVDWKGSDRTAVDAATGPGAAGPPRSATMRASVALILLGLCAAVWAYGIVIVDIASFDIFDRADAGLLEAVDADAFDSRADFISNVTIGLQILAGTAFLAWLSRVVENIPRLRAGRPSKSPRASIGWWFVPFANIVVPYQIVADVERLLARATSRRPLTVLVVAWWVLWMTGVAISQIGARLMRRADTIPDLRSVATWGLVADVLIFVAALLVMVIVARIQSMEDQRLAAVDTPPPPTVAAATAS